MTAPTCTRDPLLAAQWHGPLPARWAGRSATPPRAGPPRVAPVRVRAVVNRLRPASRAGVRVVVPAR